MSDSRCSRRFRTASILRCRQWKTACIPISPRKPTGNMMETRQQKAMPAVAGATTPKASTPDSDLSLKRKRQPRNSACQGCAALKMKCIATANGKCERYVLVLAFRLNSNDHVRLMGPWWSREYSPRPDNELAFDRRLRRSRQYVRVVCHHLTYGPRCRRAPVP